MGLNYANLDRLIGRLESIPSDRFAMHCVFTERGNPNHSLTLDEVLPSEGCGTAACIAGWCSFVRSREFKGTAAEAAWLGISFDQERELFFAFGQGYDYIPLARALDVLRHLRATGEVDWKRFPYENYVKPKAAWTPPVAVEVKADLPAVLTSLLRPNAEVVS